MDRWIPVRKVAAAAITAILGAPLFIAWLMGQDGVGFREAAGAAVVAAVPVLVAYLTPASKDGLEGGYSIDPDPGEQ